MSDVSGLWLVTSETMKPLIGWGVIRKKLAPLFYYNKVSSVSRGNIFLYKQLLSWCPDLLLIGLLFLKKPSNWQHRRQLKTSFTFSKSKNNDFIWTDPRATILQYNTVVSFYNKTLTINITLHINQDLYFSVPAAPATLRISSMCSQFRWHSHNNEKKVVFSGPNRRSGIQSFCQSFFSLSSLQMTIKQKVTIFPF